MSLFRKRALERISSPDHLDEALIAAAPRHWIAFFGAAGLVAAAAVWGFLGSLPTRISADGILLQRESEIFSAAAEGDGQLIDILVGIGGKVERGQAVALLKQDVDEASLKRANEALSRERNRLDALVEERDADMTRRAKLNAKRIKSAEEKLANSRYRKTVLEKRLASVKGLMEKGYTDRTTVFEAENDLAKANEEITELQYYGLDIDVETNQAREDWRQRIVAQEKEVEDRKETIENLTQLLKLRSTVDAPISGTVTEIAASLGDVVSAGTPIIRIASHGGAADALLFLSPREGKRVKPGFDVNVEPSVVRKEEVGTVLAVVSSVSDLPLSSSAIDAMLHNDKLVEEFSKDGPPIAIRADLKVDPAAPSRLAWTGGTGPDFGIEPGTLVKATITVREQAPVTLILPFLRSVLGL